MKAQEHHITVGRTARYYTLGDPAGDLEQVWFVCHGHTYLASRFIRFFRVLDNGHRLIVAPEGLSRFYVDHNARRVGASWMTCEDRLSEISDYVSYLDELYRRVFETLDRGSVEVHVLGFSQGAATAARWTALGSSSVDKLTLWAGLVPPDLDLSSCGLMLDRAKLKIVLAEADEYVDPEETREMETRLLKHGVSHDLIRFDGGHVLDQSLLQQLALSRNGG